ncbi:MAG: HAD-IA family hydrolase [Cyclobacteriaceae bacterium]|nr:HAD family hydrolase [Cyclobacteriaceae bacterium]MCH8516924.1 HAD-IA family hydrolase [Cyclobacteriaceae bacterium]
MKKVIFWDFDGVILNSNAIRDQGFEAVLKGFPKEEVDQLIQFHQSNGGLSRYVKFRYFFEEIRKVSITDDQVAEWAAKFSAIMLAQLKDPNLLIQETVSFIKTMGHNHRMFIVSGSDQTELRTLCEFHGLSPFFERIHGSPTPKKEWVHAILEEEQLDSQECVLIGDSINDYEAANVNGIDFMAYNNEELEEKTTYQLDFRSER